MTASTELTRVYWQEAFDSGLPIEEAALWFDSWRASMEDRSPIRDRTPWMTYGAIAALRDYIKPGHSVFEYGAGGSTMFFLDRGARVVSVEHSEKWAQVVRENTQVGLELHVCPPTAGRGYQSSKLDGSFRDYVAVIDRYGLFDVVVVDGRCRNDCIRHALPHVRPGGLLVLDNADRRRYRSGIGQVAGLGWTRTDCEGPGPYEKRFWRTTIWQHMSNTSIDPVVQ